MSQSSPRSAGTIQCVSCRLSEFFGAEASEPTTAQSAEVTLSHYLPGLFVEHPAVVYELIDDNATFDFCFEGKLRAKPFCLL